MQPVLIFLWLGLILADCTSGVFLQRITSSPPPYSVDDLKNGSTTRYWFDVIYPMRRSQSLGAMQDSLLQHAPLKDTPQQNPRLQSPIQQDSRHQDSHHHHLETGTYMTYVHPVHLTNPWRRRASMRDGVDAMMDRLLSVRRLPGVKSP